MMIKNFLPNKSAVIIIDMDNLYLNHVEISERQRLLEEQKKILKKAVKEKLPIISLGHDKKDLTVEELKENIPENYSYFYISKPDTDSFVNSGLLEKLNILNINALLIMGIFASECVKKTVITAIKNKFRVLTNPRLLADPFDWEENKSQKWFEQNTDIIF